MHVLDGNLADRLHKDVLVPYTVVAAALALPTIGEQATALKAAIWDNANNKIPVVENTTTWTFELLKAVMGSVDQAAALNLFITEALGESFPFHFTVSGGS